jgi:hypothetical protein
MRERVTQAETFPALRDERAQPLQRHTLRSVGAQIIGLEP